MPKVPKSKVSCCHLYCAKQPRTLYGVSQASCTQTHKWFRRRPPSGRHFLGFDPRKNITSPSCRGSRPSWELLGVGSSNQLQVAQGQGLVRDCALMQAAIGCCILLLLVPKMVLTLCNLRWWCFSCTNYSTREASVTILFMI